MIKLKIQLKDKLVKTSIPSTWNEVTVRQFIDLGYSTMPKHLAVIEALSVLTQIPMQDLEIAEGDLKPLLAVSNLLTKAPDMSQVVKADHFSFLMKTYYIKDLSKMNMHQVAVDAMSSEHKYHIAKSLAIIIQEQLDGKINLDQDRLTEIEEDILKYPFLPLYPAISFFLNKKINSLLLGLTNLN